MQNASWRLELFFFVFLVVFFVYQLGGYPLMVPDEGRYGEIAREMAVGHDWLTPRLNGIPFLDKPILFYWMAASLMSWLGAKLWVVRLWPVIIALFGCATVYYTAWHLYGRRAARISAFILATTPLYFLAGHYVNMDLTVAVFITSSLCSFIVAVHEENRRRQIAYFVAAYVFSSFALLSKGLIGIVFPMLIIGAWIIVTRQWRSLLNMWLIPGLALTAAICLPWFIAEQHANPHFFDYFFINQHFERYTQHSFNNLQTWWFYLVVAFGGFLPWSIIWPRYERFATTITHLKNSATQLSTIFFILWAIIVLVFFSIPSSKLVGYILPIFPPLALLVGRAWEQHWQSAQRRFKLVASASVIFLLGVMTYLPHMARYSSAPLAAAIQAQGLQANERINIYHLYMPDLSFYLQQQVDIISVWGPPYDVTTDGWKRPFFYAKLWGMANEHMIIEKDFWPVWQKSKRQLMVVRGDVVKYFYQHAQGKYTLVWQSGRVYLFSNQVAPAKAQNLPVTKVKHATAAIASATAKG